VRTEPVRSSRLSEDPRARRSRERIARAAYDEVVRAGTTDLTVVRLAQVAGLSRQALYLHFADGDEVVAATALELVREDLRPRAYADLLPDRPETPESIRRLVDHVAAHRAFYAAFVRGAHRHLLADLVLEWFGFDGLERVRATLAPDLTPADVADFIRFYNAGIAALLADWLLDPVPTGPEAIAARIWKIYYRSANPPAP